MADFPAHLLDGLDLSAFEAICRSATSTRHKHKYGDLSVHMGPAWKAAKRLGVDKSPPLDILDIGLGAGYFLYVCQKLGHRGVGLDRPGFQLWQGIREWLGVNHVIEHTIGPNTRLPEIGRFDLATAYACPFNYVRDENRLWRLSEWSFFLDHLRDDVLKPNGRLVLKQRLRYPGGLEPGREETDQFAQLCRQRGAGEGPLLIFDPLR